MPARLIILIDDSQGAFRRSLPWIGAYAATILLHGFVFWYFTHEGIRPPAPPAPEPAAVMVDLAPVVQQAFSQNDAAVGQPMQEASDPPPPPPDPTPDPMPNVEESPTLPASPLPPKPPEKPKIKLVRPNTQPTKEAQRKPSMSAASRTTSAPRSDQHAERTTAASAGAASSAAAATWRNEVRAAIERNKRYPAGETASGSPYITFIVSPSGFIGNVSIVASSGVASLDRAAVDTVRRTSVSPPPSGVSSTITFRMNLRPR